MVSLYDCAKVKGAKLLREAMEVQRNLLKLDQVYMVSKAKARRKLKKQFQRKEGEGVVRDVVRGGPQEDVGYSLLKTV